MHTSRKGRGGKVDLVIQPAETHVWLTFYEWISEERLLAAYRELLDGSEKEEESRFYFARDRQRYLVTRALVRTVLSRYASVDPKDWVFSTDGYGRPHIVNREATDGGLSFSVSHTKGLIALGVAKGRSLGVDVENFARPKISIDMAAHYFAAQETAALRELPHARQYRFFEYWTFKESYIKARGMGFSLPLDRFSFHFADEHAVALVIDPELGDDPSRWQLWQLQPTSEHLLAVCAERLNAEPPRLIVSEITPAVGQRLLTAEILRTSEISKTG